MTAPALLLSPILAVAMAASLPQASDCEQVARIIRRAAQQKAHAAFWLEVAAAREGPDHELPDRMKAARLELKEAIALAKAQYRARVEACALLGPDPYDPVIVPEEFTPEVTHPRFPLVPGVSLVYEQQGAKGLTTVECTALAEVIDIGGVECRVVHTLEYENGELVEDTKDWYAQHIDGDVWYFGEISLEYEDGFLETLAGSWRWGKDGAKPGVVMGASPAPELVVRSEYLVEEAEDLTRVVSLDETVVTAQGTYHHCVVIEEWSPLEPGELDRKYFAPGIGLVLEINVVTGERLELVQIIQK